MAEIMKEQDYSWQLSEYIKPEKLKTVVLLDASTGKVVLGYYTQSIDLFFSNTEKNGKSFNATHWIQLPPVTFTTQSETSDNKS